MAVVKRVITTTNTVNKREVNIGLFTNILEYEFGNAPLNDILTTDDSVADRVISAANTIRKKLFALFAMPTNFIEYCFGEIPFGTFYADKNRETSKRGISTANTVTKRTITAS